MYMDEDFHTRKSYQFTNCVNATNIPCSVPQIKDIVDPETQKHLDICASAMDYNCGKMILFHGLMDVGGVGQTQVKCPKPCEKLHYKLVQKDTPLKLPRELTDSWPECMLTEVPSIKVN